MIMCTVDCTFYWMEKVKTKEEEVEHSQAKQKMG